MPIYEENTCDLYNSQIFLNLFLINVNISGIQAFIFRYTVYIDDRVVKGKLRAIYFATPIESNILLYRDHKYWL